MRLAFHSKKSDGLLAYTLPVARISSEFGRGSLMRISAPLLKRQDAVTRCLTHKAKGFGVYLGEQGKGLCCSSGVQVQLAERKNFLLQR